MTSGANYDDVFKAEALRLARESRSTQAAARALNIDPERTYQWQRQAPLMVARPPSQQHNQQGNAEGGNKQEAKYIDY